MDKFEELTEQADEKWPRSKCTDHYKKLLNEKSNEFCKNTLNYHHNDILLSLARPQKILTNGPQSSSLCFQSQQSKENGEAHRAYSKLTFFYPPPPNIVDGWVPVLIISLFSNQFYSRFCDLLIVTFTSQRNSSWKSSCHLF